MRRRKLVTNPSVWSVVVVPLPLVVVAVVPMAVVPVAVVSVEVAATLLGRGEL